MGVYGRLCVPRSIDSASIPQQPCDPSVMLLIVTPPGSRASARARQSEGKGGRRNGGGQMARGTGRGREEGGRRGQSWKHRRIAGAGMEKERRMGLGSLWDYVQGRPSCFLRPLVPLCSLPCPFMSSRVPGRKVTRRARSPL